MPVWDNTLAEFQSQFNHMLLGAVLVISKNQLRNSGPELHDATEILSFKTFLFIYNVCRLFHIINKNTSSFYVALRPLKAILFVLQGVYAAVKTSAIVEQT